MKLDLTYWKEVENADVWNTSPKGRLRLRFSKEVAVLVRQSDPETGEILAEGIAGFGAEFFASFDPNTVTEWKALSTVVAYVHDPANEVFYTLDVEEVFTNVDKKPLESQHVLEVQKALRLMKFELKHEKQMAIEQFRQELARKAPAKQVEAKQPDPEVVAKQPDPEVKPASSEAK